MKNYFNRNILKLPLLALFITKAQETFAQSTTSTSVVSNFCSQKINDFTGFLNFLIKCLLGGFISKALIAISVIVFSVGILRLLWGFAKGDQEDYKKIGGYITTGIIALFVMLSLWGIIFIIGSTFGIGQGGVAPLPSLPTGN